MSKGETLRALVNERLTAAAEEIFALVERTIAEYEEELCRSKEENQRKQQLLDQALAPPPVPQVPQINAQSSDVQIQTVIVKSEGDDTDDEESSERPAPCPQTVDTVTLIEVCTQEDPTVHQETPTEITAVINPSPQTANARSSVDLSNQDEMENTIKTSVGKRKRGRPRRVMAPTDAEEMHLQQPPKQPKEKGEEPKRIERRGAEAHPTRSTQETQLQIEIEGDATCKVDLDQTPVQNFQIKTEKQDDTGASLDQAHVHDRLWSNSGVSEREERLQNFTAATNFEQKERREDMDSEDWSYDWQPQPGSSHQPIDSDEDEYNPAAENDGPFTEFTGKKVSMKSGHTGEVEGKVKHECPVCRKKLGRKQELKRHMLLHTGEKPFSCPVCNKRFIQKSNLKSHIVTHLDSVDTIIRFQKPLEPSRETEGDDWEGTGTDLTLDEREKLTDNLSDSDNDEDWAEMMEPGESSSSQQMETEGGNDDHDNRSLERISLLLHQALNESKARGKTTEFQCPMCDKIFGRMENLRRHLLVHTGEKAFSCPVCNKQFTLKQHLKLHMVLHTRDQQFTCSVCSKTFIRKDNLRSHMRIHSTDRPFGCSECGARFYTDQDLARHTAHHKGERSFVCPVCNSGFLSRRYLNRHIKIHKREEEKAKK